MSGWLIVGLSGVTNGGKTTLARKLLDVLPVGTQIIKQDDYFLHEEDPRHVACPGGLNHHNWDIISSINMEAMMRDVLQVVGSQSQTSSFTQRDQDHSGDAMEGKPRPILLLEGFLLFGDSQMAELCELRYFLTLTQDQCWQRRRRRHYDPPDPPGYFEMCVWPMYLHHYQYVRENVCGVTFLDGQEDHFQDVLRSVQCAANLKQGASLDSGLMGKCVHM